MEVKDQTHADVVNVDELFNPLVTDDRMVKWSKADGRGEIGGIRWYHGAGKMGQVVRQRW